MPVLGHHCLFSRSGNLPFLKPNLIKTLLRQRSALLVRIPGQFRRSRSPPDHPHSAAPRVHVAAKKINVCQEPYEPLCIARAWRGELHQSKFRILPPTSRHLPFASR